MFLSWWIQFHRVWWHLISKCVFCGLYPTGWCGTVFVRVYFVGALCLYKARQHFVGISRDCQTDTLASKRHRQHNAYLILGADMAYCDCGWLDWYLPVQKLWAELVKHCSFMSFEQSLHCPLDNMYRSSKLSTTPGQYVFIHCVLCHQHR